MPFLHMQGRALLGILRLEIIYKLCTPLCSLKNNIDNGTDSSFTTPKLHFSQHAALGHYVSSLGFWIPFPVLVQMMSYCSI